MGELALLLTREIGGGILVDCKAAVLTSAHLVSSCPWLMGADSAGRSVMLTTWRQKDRTQKQRCETSSTTKRSQSSNHS